MTPTLERLYQQLEAYSRLHQQRHDFRFNCIEHLVLQHGLVFERCEDPPPIKPIAKACFQQAYRLATRKNSKWIYCEGYAVGKMGLAVHHAWVISPDHLGAAHELAWPNEPCERAYMGIPFEAEFVRKTHYASKRAFFSVLDTWWQDYPLITGATKIEDVEWNPYKGQK